MTTAGKFVILTIVGIWLLGCSNPRFVLIYEDGETSNKKLKVESVTQIGEVKEPEAVE